MHQDWNQFTPNSCATSSNINLPNSHTTSSNINPHNFCTTSSNINPYQPRPDGLDNNKLSIILSSMYHNDSNSYSSIITIPIHIQFQLVSYPISIRIASNSYPAPSNINLHQPRSCMQSIIYHPQCTSYTNCVIYYGGLVRRWHISTIMHWMLRGTHFNYRMY